MGEFLKVVKAPALPGGDKSRQKGSVEREGVWWVPRTQEASVAATNSLRRRVEENELMRERAETPNRKAFAGPSMDLAFIMQAFCTRVTGLNLF